MKTKLNLIAIVFSMLFFSACDKAEELTTFYVNDTFVIEAPVVIPEDPEGNPQNFIYSSEIDIRENADIDSNFGNIQHLAINDFYLSISDYLANENIFAEDVVVTVGNVIISLGDIDLSAFSATDERIQIGETQQLNEIASQLLNSSTITVSIEGTVSDTPVTFTATAVMDIRVTVNAI